MKILKLRCHLASARNILRLPKATFEVPRYSLRDAVEKSVPNIHAEFQVIGFTRLA